MTESANASPNNTDLCGCCEGTSMRTPLEVYNRPGLSAIAYRVGTHARFKRSMLARLSASELPKLKGLNTRDDDDFAIALLDGWATVADVLTFYQERIANETYLRTATERLSLIQLARLIDYELRPGVAAGAYLAFELEDVAGVPRAATIESGTKVQSLPGQGETPQTFETVESIEARAEWNRLRPRLTKPRSLARRDDHLYLKGITTNLRPGDTLLFVSKGRARKVGGRWDARRISEVTPDPDADRTLVRWDEPLKGLARRSRSTSNGPEVYAFRLRAALFGHNAPAWNTLPVALRIGEKNPQEDGDPFIRGAYSCDAQGNEPPWADDDLDDPTVVNLDSVYGQVVAGSWILLASPDHTKLYRVTSASEETQAQFNMTAKTTRLELSEENIDQKSPEAVSEAESTDDSGTGETGTDGSGANGFSRRTITVHAQSERLKLAEHPIVNEVGGDRLPLDGIVAGLTAGRSVVVSGTTAEGERAAEVATLETEPHDADGVTVLCFDRSLENAYRRDSVTIYANVARATHGETKNETLGSGDAGATYQSFELSTSPLTHVGAPTPSGAETTLELRVDEVEWHEVPTLYGRGPRDRVYVTRTDEKGKTTVQFGDARTGARLPTGQENVRARYRVGIGQEGLVKAEQLSLLVTQPLGVRGVTNPMPSSGAADPELDADARRNAPLTVLTLDRVVSLRDYEDFARAFAGIAKAHATWAKVGQVRGVLLTVAAQGGAVADQDLLSRLYAAMRRSGDAHIPLEIQSPPPTPFKMDATLEIHPDFVQERVGATVRSALESAFSFEARSFGQEVALSKVIYIIQDVAGVVGVDVDYLYTAGEDPKLSTRLPGEVAADGDRTRLVPRLLVLHNGSDGLVLHNGSDVLKPR